MLNTKWAEDHKAGSHKHLLILKGGFIPAATECPFTYKCEQNKAGKCFHYGFAHQTPFQCRTANLYDEGKL